MSTTTKHLLSGVEETLGPEMMAKIQNSKILLVGAGGIGCELLKNLALTGFRHVQIIDLDTIDVSNLNRQLLFRSQHVGMPKCTVAAQVATQMVGDASRVFYKAHHGNVCDNSQFNVPFVQQFDLVLNALDNVVARRRVNRLCLAADVPLVEAGTTGYLGQVNVIHKPSNVACYECQTQEPPKVYPICTIRSTPSMPVHTIVWAKELYKLLFGQQVEESMLYEDINGEEPSTFMEAILSFRTLFQQIKNDPNNQVADETIGQHASQMITKLYVAEIQKQLDMDRYKTARKTPQVLAHDIIANGTNSVAPSRRASYNHQDIWSPQDCVAEFVACLKDALHDDNNVLPCFDKDNDLSMRLVTATCNLRAFVFGIEPLQSYYSAKGIAGNIIPAISTTNAVCAGLQILQTFQILKAQLQGDNLKDYCSYINCVRNKTRNGLYLTACALENPNPNCFVCKNASVPLALNTTQWTLDDFLHKIVKKDLGFEEPTLLLENGDVIWEEGQDADHASFETNLGKLLPDLPCGGIQHGTVVTIEDFSQDLTVHVTVAHQEVWDKDDDDEEQDNDDFKFVIGGTKPVPTSDAKPPAAESNGGKENDMNRGEETNGNKKDDDDEDEDDFIEIVDDSGSDKKRPAEEENGEPAAKKAKTENGNSSNDVEVIEIDN